MEISGIEKFSRYFALTSLVVAAVLGSLLHFGIVKMPGSRGAESNPAAQATPPPAPPGAKGDDSRASASGNAGPAGSGSFQADLSGGSRS
jgi:hypothetical protein